MTTYLEMFLHSTRTAAEHVAPLARFTTRARDDPRGGPLRLVTCDDGDGDCASEFAFGEQDEVPAHIARRGGRGGRGGEERGREGMRGDERG